MITDIKQHFFYKNWWLFYTLFFLLLGLLLYALMWKKPDCTTEINDWKNKNSLLLKEITDLRNKNKALINELEQCTNEAEKNNQHTQQTVDCNATVNSGTQGFTSTKHRLGLQSGTVVVEFDADNIPDEFVVTYDGQVVASSNGPVSHAGEMSWVYKAGNGKPDFCEVQVSAPQSGTKWDYRLNCPQ